MEFRFQGFYNCLLFQMADIFDDMLDFDLPLFEGTSIENPCVDHLAHDGRCIFSLSREELLRCLYKRKAHNVPSCPVCSDWDVSFSQGGFFRLRAGSVGNVFFFLLGAALQELSP